VFGDQFLKTVNHFFLSNNMSTPPSVKDGGDITLRFPPFSPLFCPYFLAHVVSSLAYLNSLRKKLDCCCLFVVNRSKSTLSRLRQSMDMLIHVGTTLTWIWYL
jgi:hypothetical protein